MRIHTDDATLFIRRFADTLMCDPASLEGWRCLHVEPSRETEAETDLNHLNGVKHAHKDLDCEIICSPDRELFFISRELSAEALESLADTILSPHRHATVGVHKRRCYDVFHEWHALYALLLSKSREDSPAAAPLPAEAEAYDFGEIRALRDVFEEVRKQRKFRHPLHVMVVEDDPLTRRVASNAFKNNYALITAGDAQEAITNYLIHAPDIVFLDIGLPGASGFSVLKQLITYDPDAYIVMFSGNSYLDNVTTALAAGACGFIAKPFKKEKMRHYIEDSAWHHRKLSA